MGKQARTHKPPRTGKSIEPIFTYGRRGPYPELAGDPPCLFDPKYLPTIFCRKKSCRLKPYALASFPPLTHIVAGTSHLNYYHSLSPFTFTSLVAATLAATLVPSNHPSIHQTLTLSHSLTLSLYVHTYIQTHTPPPCIHTFARSARRNTRHRAAGIAILPTRSNLPPRILNFETASHITPQKRHRTFFTASPGAWSLSAHHSRDRCR